MQMNRAYTLFTSARYQLNRKSERTYSFFFVLNLISPKARDTEISPQILPLTICRHNIHPMSTHTD